MKGIRVDGQPLAPSPSGRAPLGRHSEEEVRYLRIRQNLNDDRETEGIGFRLRRLLLLRYTWCNIYSRMAKKRSRGYLFKRKAECCSASSGVKTAANPAMIDDNAQARPKEKEDATRDEEVVIRGEEAEE